MQSLGHDAPVVYQSHKLRQSKPRSILLEASSDSAHNHVQKIPGLSFKPPIHPLGLHAIFFVYG